MDRALPRAIRVLGVVLALLLVGAASVYWPYFVTASEFCTDIPDELRDAGDPYARWTPDMIAEWPEDQVHPANAAQSGIVALLIGDVRGAEHDADRLIGAADRIGGAMYFPYEFEHGTMKPTWYSGMAQGQAASLFVRLWQATDDGAYLVAADAALLPLFEMTEPTVAYRDGSDYWIETFPSEPHNPVLNGHIFGAYGLYDYWRATGDETAYRYLHDAVRTVAVNLHRFRHAGAGGSWYDWDRTWIANEMYHAHVREQVRFLADMTQAPCLEVAADRFEADGQPFWWLP